MSGTPSSRAERLLFPTWVAFAVGNAALMIALPDHETIPFHFVWISMSVIYGVRPWSHIRTASVLLCVVAFSGFAIQRSVLAGRVDWQEITEVPLMALVFVTMVWHVQRRVAALRQSDLMAASERRAHEVKELFVRNCSHEMRTPITVARGYTELVRRDVEEGQSGDDLGIVLDELAKLDHLTGRLVTLAEAYRASEFRLAPVDLKTLVERTVQRWRPSASRAWTVETRSVTALGDQSRLETALDALVENAVKFTLDGDGIAVRCHGRNGVAVLEVEDTGIGLVRSARRSGPPYSSGGQGTGLGLSIVRAIADGHDGRCELLEGAAGGALVRLTLPACAPAAEPTGAGRVPSQSTPALQTRV